MIFRIHLLEILTPIHRKSSKIHIQCNPIIFSVESFGDCLYYSELRLLNPGHGGPSKQIWDSMICARIQPEVSVLTTPAKIELAVTCATFPVRNIGGSAWLKDSERHIALLPTRHPTDQRADHLDHTPCSPHLMAHCRFCPSSLAWGVDDRSLHHAAVTDLGDTLYSYHYFPPTFNLNACIVRATQTNLTRSISETNAPTSVARECQSLPQQPRSHWGLPRPQMQVGSRAGDGGNQRVGDGGKPEDQLDRDDSGEWDYC